MFKKRKRNKNIILKTSTLCIISIISLSIIGTGYAGWNSNLNMNTSISTGFIKSRIKSLDLNLKQGEYLTFDFSEENQTLSIKGIIYESSDLAIPIEIIDEGTIPTFLKNVERENNSYSVKNVEFSNSIDLVTWDNQGSINNTEDKNKIINLIIDPSFDIKDKTEIETQDVIESEEIDEILKMQSEIEKYNAEKNYIFKYNLSLEQGL